MANQRRALARADRGDHVRRNHRRQQAKAAFGQAKARLGTADGDVATRHQADAAAERGAIDARNGGLGQFVQRAHQARQRQCIGRIVGFAGADHAAHPVQVGAGGKRRAGTGDDHDPHLRIGTGLLQGAGEGGNQGRVERVVHCRAIEPQRTDRSWSSTIKPVSCIAHASMNGMRTMIAGPPAGAMTRCVDARIENHS